MWESILNSALANGLWAALFVALMIYVLRDTAKREKNYQDMERSSQKIINSLSESVRVVKEIKEQTSEIGKALERHCLETSKLPMQSIIEPLPAEIIEVPAKHAAKMKAKTADIIKTETAKKVLSAAVIAVKTISANNASKGAKYE